MSEAQRWVAFSGTEFETAWRGFRGDTALQANYILLLEPKRLPQLFKFSLTGSMLASIVTSILFYLKQVWSFKTCLNASKQIYFCPFHFYTSYIKNSPILESTRHSYNFPAIFAAIFKSILSLSTSKRSQ